MNAWHDISIGEKAPQICTAVIEIPAESKVKYELDKESGLIMVDRILSTSMRYPANYGFFPQTYCDDKDPLDVLVLGQYPVVPMSLMQVRPVGVIKMIDGGEGDDKIIAVHAADPHYKHITKLSEVAPHVIQELKQFFVDYKNLEKKKVEITSIENEEVALKVIQEAIELYKKEF